MAKQWKHLALVAGLLGLIGIFQPLLRTETKSRFGPHALELTAYQLTFGLDKTHAVLGRELPPVLEKRLSPAVREARTDARLVAEASRGAVLLFVPALVLLAFGIVGLIKQRFGRVLGALTFVFGAASIAAFFGLRYGIDYGMREAGFKRTTVEAIDASYLLIVIGAIGVVAAIGALVLPQRPTVRTHHPAPLRPPPGPPPPGPAIYPPAGP